MALFPSKKKKEKKKKVKSFPVMKKEEQPLFIPKR